MSNWQEFHRSEPDLADEVHRRFTIRRHHTMATLRADGSPRISGIEVIFQDGELFLGMMERSRKAADLRRDGRLAIHSATVDPADDDPTDWPGEAKLTGLATEITDPAQRAAQFAEIGEVPEASALFRVELREVVLTRVGAPADHLLITLWTPGSPLRSFRRA